MDEAEPDLRSDLVDLSNIDLVQLDGVAESAFGAAIRRILAERPGETDVYCAFMNDI